MIFSRIRDQFRHRAVHPSVFNVKTCFALEIKFKFFNTMSYMYEIQLAYRLSQILLFFFSQPLLSKFALDSSPTTEPFWDQLIPLSLHLCPPENAFTLILSTFFFVCVCASVDNEEITRTDCTKRLQVQADFSFFLLHMKVRTWCLSVMSKARGVFMGGMAPSKLDLRENNH